MAAFGDKDTQKRHVAQPAMFMENRKHTVTYVAAQIPFYAKIGSRKELFMSWERQTKESKRALRGEQRYLQEKKSKILSLAKVEEIEKTRGMAEEKQSQKRGRTNVDQDKCRVSLETRQAIENDVDLDRSDRGSLAKHSHSYESLRKAFEHRKGSRMDKR